MVQKTKVINIGLPYYDNSSWVGGKNYIDNLLFSIKKLNKKKLNFYFISKKKIKKKNVIYCKYLDTNLGFYRLTTYLRYLSIIFFNKDYFLENFFKKNNIDIISHGVTLGTNSKIKSLTWIPDFQSFSNPKFFPFFQRIKRQLYISFLIKNSHRIVLSSKDAYKNFIKYTNGDKEKITILPFTNKPFKVKKRLPKKVPQKFYLIANQFWKHKNHKILFKAINFLKSKNRKINIVCTGDKFDNRWQEYIHDLTNYIKMNELSDRVFILGKIRKNDLYSLFHYCTALINPSFSEGWNTAVEEAKSIGKRTILSNIKVHIEQDKDGIFFNPNDYKKLSSIMLENWNKNSWIKRKEKNYQKNIKNFGETYLKTLINLVKEKNIK